MSNFKFVTLSFDKFLNSPGKRGDFLVKQLVKDSKKLESFNVKLTIIQPYLVNYFWLKGQFISLRFLNYNYLFRPIWTNSDQSGSFWTILDQSGPFWTIFGPFWTISLVFYDLCTGNGAQYGTSVVLNMPLTTQIVFEFFLAILANIVGLFRMHVPYMLSHVIFKINLFSTNQTFKSGFSIIVKNFLIFCLHFQDILFVCSYTCNNLNIKFFSSR